MNEFNEVKDSEEIEGRDEVTIAIRQIQEQQNNIRIDGKKKLRIAIYCRVSTGSDEQKNSFENQIFKLTETVNKNQNWELVDVYGDRGTSGTIMDRKEFIRMMNDCGIDSKTWQIVGDSKIDLILCKNTSRFARNVGGANIALDTLKKNDCFVHFLDINKGSYSSNDMMFIQFLSVVDATESAEKSNRIAFGFEASRDKNKIRSNNKLFGYTYTKEHKLIQNEDSKTVRFIFEEYLKGKGGRVIAQELNENPKINPSGKTWSSSTVRKILENEKFAGINNPLKWTSGSITRKKFSPKLRQGAERHFKVSDDIEAIVSLEEFRECQRIRESKVNKYSISKSGLKSGVSDFGGKIICGRCGYKYNHNIDKDKKTGAPRPFYNCAGKKKFGTKFCDSPNLSSFMIRQLIEQEEFLYRCVLYDFVFDYCLKCVNTIINYYRNGKCATDLKEVNERKRKNEQKLETILSVLDTSQLSDSIKNQINILNREIMNDELIIKKLKSESSSEELIEWLESIRNSITSEDLPRIYNFINHASKITLKTSAEFRNSMRWEKRVIETMSPFHQTKEGENGIWLECEYDEFNMLECFDDLRKGFTLDRFNCCRIFTRVNDIEQVGEWFVNHSDITEEDIISYLESEENILEL